MNTHNIKMNIVFAILGFLLLAAGGIGMKSGWFPGIPALPAILIGIGAGLFGSNLGTIIQVRTIEKDPAEARRIHIEQKDERNVSIDRAAKSKAFDAMVYIYGAVMLIFALLNADLVFILLLVAAYLLVIGIRIYQMSRLIKEM